jgi:hypothetical protein
MLWSLILLALESNRVIALRSAKLMLGGKEAQREVELMVREKLDAALEAGASVMGGASGPQIIRQYRRRVRANAKRLSKSSNDRDDGRELVRRRYLG